MGHPDDFDANAAAAAGYGSTTPAQDGAENAQAAHDAAIAAEHERRLRAIYETATTLHLQIVGAEGDGVPCPVEGEDWWQVGIADLSAALARRFNPEWRP